ncbi:MAG: chromate transporter [Lachnospiraceae bacterium]|nr:chromate transporter [Lachnospiraceae bacterium]
MKDLFALYAAFFRIGGLTFGGGLTMLPMLQHELVDKKHWVEEEDLLDYYAVGQCTPGIIAVNVATFVGYKKKGIPGAIFSTLGMISPSLIIVSIIALFLNEFMSNEYVAHAVAGIKVVVCALMLNTVFTMAKKTIKNYIGAIVCVLAFVVAMFTPVPTVLIVIAAGVFGILLTKIKKKEEGKK